MPDYLGLITSEHNDKPKFNAMVEAVTGCFAGAYDVALSIPGLFDLDTAVGAQLDIVGLWVGQSRNIPGVLVVQFFGFSDNPAALSYGEEGQPAYGGRFYEEGEPIGSTSILGDPEYRMLLRAKIVKNHAKGTTADIIKALTFIFAAPAVVDDTTGDMSIGVAIGRELTFVERAILTELDILPRPAGVRIRWMAYYNAEGYLGFEGQPGAVPFAEEGYTGPIGQLMEEF